jgi:hypothetical protein
MNVEIGTKATQSHFWEYLFIIFDIVFAVYSLNAVKAKYLGLTNGELC